MLIKLTKQKFFLIIIGIWVLAAIPTFYATLLLLEGVLNIECPSPLAFLRLTPGLAFLPVSMNLILSVFFFLRLYIHPTYEKKMLKIYGIILASFSLFGIIFTFIAGLALYHSLAAPYPWAGFYIILLIFYLAMMALSYFMLFYFPKKITTETTEVRKINYRYVLKTIGLSLLFFIALNRLGGLMLFPSYIQWITIPLTYPAYLALLFPSLILLVDLLYIFNFLHAYPKAGLVASTIILCLSLFFFLMILYRGTTNPLFVQLCSPFNPLGRLVPFPIDTVLEAIISFGLASLTLVNSFYFSKMSNYDNHSNDNQVVINHESMDKNNPDQKN